MQAASFRVVYGTPQNNDERDARSFILDEGVIRTVSGLLNDEFSLRSDLTLFLGGRSGPRFDAVSNEIYMPYGFVFDIADRFKRSAYSGTRVNIYDVTRDAYLYALLHLVSHALFTMYGIRTTGDVEKTVDALTTLLLLRYYEDGGDVVLHAAGLFDVQAGAGSAGRSAPGFWEEHEFDRQSYNQAVCLVYGSDPKRYQRLRRDNAFLQTGAEGCIREYQRQNGVWFRVLGSFLKRPPPD